MKRYLKQMVAGLLLLVSLADIDAQKTYELQWTTDLTLTGLGLTTGITGLAISKKIEPLKSPEILLLNRNDVFPIDRRATYWLSGKADKASDYFFYGATVAPLLLLTDRKARKEAGVISIMYLETLTLTGGLTHLTKNAVKRIRPYAYNPAFPIDLKQRPEARRSFFSGHTSSTATACFFTAKVWSDLHPGSNKKPVVWAAAAAIPAITGYLRMRAGRHFFTDVAVGYAVGSVVGWLVPFLHESSRVH